MGGGSACTPSGAVVGSGWCGEVLRGDDVREMTVILTLRGSK